MSRFTINDLSKSKAAHLNGHILNVRPNRPNRLTRQKPSKEKEWISWNLVYWCNQNAIDLKNLKEEHRFHPDRKWRFDYAITSLMIGIEYDGLFSEKSRHTTAKGFTGDADKLNAAAALGWRVIRLTAINYKNLISELNKYA